MGEARIVGDSGAHGLGHIAMLAMSRRPKSTYVLRQYTRFTSKSQGSNCKLIAGISQLELAQERCILGGMNHRSYHQYCGLAYALDIIGERWTLLIVRELVAGPRRFTDLMEGLPGISTNLLTERLKSLEQAKILRRRVLPPPAGSTVYELTPLGQGLEKALLDLGKWGSQFVPPTWEGEHLLHLGSYALTPMTFFRAEAAQEVNDVTELRIDGEVLQVQIQAGKIHVQQGEMLKADVVLHTDMPTYIKLFAGALTLDEACAQGLICIAGNPAALHRFLHLCGLPHPRPEQS